MPLSAAMATTGTRWLRLLRTQMLVLAITLVMCEIGLRVLMASPVGAVLRPVPLVTNELLGTRGNPHYTDHDARGYRNTQALAAAEVVTLGDSHTYGTGVERHEAWPAILATRIGRSVYSMAHGGYGPGQYERMVPEAMTLRPRAIVVGLYLGNDLFDTFAFARGKPTPTHLAGLVQRALEYDKAAPIEEQASHLWRRGRRTSPFRQWLGKHVELYRFAHEVHRRITRPPSSLLSRDFGHAVAALTPAERAYVSVVYEPEWRTIFNASYRHLGTDQRDPRILVGFELSVGALESIAARGRSAGIDVLVVVLPTKESVFWPRISDPDSQARLRELVEDEGAFRSRVLRRLSNSGIAVLDLLPALRAAAAQPYQENLDGHPNASGHVIIAERVADRVLALQAFTGGTQQ